MNQVKFKEWTCDVTFRKYPNGRPAIVLVDDEGPVTTATVNVPECQPQENYVLIKDYSENEGMLEALVEAGIVRDTGIRLEQGWVKIPICELLVEIPEEQ